MKSLDELVRGQRPAVQLAAGNLPPLPVKLVVLDDDPTGTQSVADLPVLLTWEIADLMWALATDAAAVYVMTNSRSLAPGDAAGRNREVVRAALVAASELGVRVGFVSRSDSTMRGHFPLEPETIAGELMAAGQQVDATLIVPAFPDARRITIDSVHYAGSPQGYVPVGESEFARDATFGYSSSDLRDWVAEKTGGAVPAADVVALPLDTIRQGPDGVTELLLGVPRGAFVVCDAVVEDDLVVLSAGIRAALAQGREFIYRVGPPFVRALIGQVPRPPLEAIDVAAMRTDDAAVGGLIVVGSHVALTTRQLDELRERRHPVELEVDVATILSEGRDDHIAAVADQAVTALASGNVVIRTSRALVRGTDGDDSLRIARAVSDAVVQVVNRTLHRAKPRFVIAKGGITSSDVAAHGLEMTRAVVRGPMLPGIVSLWQPTEGPATGIPYVVFAGNVGDDQALADVADKFAVR